MSQEREGRSERGREGGKEGGGEGGRKSTRSLSSIFEGAYTDGVWFHVTLLQHVVSWNNLLTTQMLKMHDVHSRALG